MNELECPITDVTNFVHHTRCSHRCCFRVSGFLIDASSVVDDLLLELRRIRKHRSGAVLLDPSLNAGKELVLLCDVFFATNVDEVDNRLCRQKELSVEPFDFIWFPIGISYTLSGL